MSNIHQFILELMCEPCHLERSMNVEIGNEYRMIFVVVFLTVPAKFILEHLDDLEKVA